MDYSVFEVFNAAEETMNFGSRSLDEDNLYEICTLCSLSVPIEEDESVHCGSSAAPIVHSCIKNGQLIIAVNNRISVLSNLQCSTLIYMEKFDAIIDCFQLNDDAQLLLLCLRSGAIVAIDFEIGKSENGRLIENFDDSAPCFINAFLETSSVGVFSFLLVNKKGVISRIRVKRGQTDDETLELIPEEIVDLRCDISSAVYSNKSKTMLLNGNELISYDIQRHIELRSDKLLIKSCFVFNKFKFMALLENGQLCLISTNLIVCNILLGRLFTKIEYFLTENDGNFMVSLCKKESGQSVFELIKFPEYASHFAKIISGHIDLVPPNNINGEYLYICNDGNGVLRVCNIYETKSMQRLQGLLRKGKYNEADAIAAKFNLSKTEIYKARVNQIIEECVLDDTYMSTLLDFLGKIDDVYLKLKVCIIASEICKEFADVQRILQYGCDLEVPKGLRICDGEYQPEDVIEKMYLFETYMQLKNITDFDCYDMKGWINFNQINLIAEVQRQLNTHHFSEAILLYSRFEMKEYELLTDNDIKKMLHSLSSVALIVSRPFLCTFVPITLRYKPNALSIIISWVRQRTQAMENTQSANNQQFPESAIDLIETILSLLRKDGGKNRNNPASSLSMISLSNDLMHGKSDVVADDNSPVELWLLLEMLGSIKLLRDEFDVSLPLAVYIENNRSLIHSFLMVPMEVENYKVFLKEFIIPYILKNNMNPDQVFLNEMKGLLAYEEKHWISIVPAIISAFKSVTLKLETVLLILCGVNPPWNDTIRSLATNAVGSAPLDHPLVTQIQQCILNEPIQIVLNKQLYSIPKGTNIADQLIFKKVIQRIIYCMIENSTPALETDIYTLCVTTELRDKANLILAETFIDNGNVEKALTYIDAVSNEGKIAACQSLLTKAMYKIGAGWFTDTCKPFWFEAFEPLISRLELLLEPFLFKLRAPKYLKIRTLALIQKHFPNSIVTLNDLCNLKSKDFLSAFLTEEFLKNCHSQDKLNELIKISCKIAATVVDESFNQTVNDVLLIICERSNNLAIIVAIADFLCQSKATSSKILSLVSVLLMRNIGADDCNSTILTPNALSQTMQNMSFYPLEEGSVGVDVDMNLRALKLAILLAEMGFDHKSDLSYDSGASEVFVWAISMCDLVQSTDPTKRGYRGVVLTMNTFNTIRQLNNLYCGIVSDFKNPIMTYLSNYTQKSEIYSLVIQLYGISAKYCKKKRKHLDAPSKVTDETCHQIEKLSAYIHFLTAERHHFTALHVVSSFRHCLIYANAPVRPELLHSLNDLSKMASAHVLQCILTEEQIDTNMAFILLTQRDSTYSARTIGEYFRLYRKNYRKLSQIADLGLRLATFYPNQIPLRDICVTMKQRCKWMLTLQPTTLTQQKFFTMKADRLLVALISAGCFAALKTLEEFCTDFALIVSDYFELYVQKTVLNWRPERNATNGTVENAATAKELYDKCMEVARLYKGDLFGIINSLWGSINCYYYEVYLAVIRILETLRPDCMREKINQKTLLNFLQEYRRVSKPGESELEEFFKRFPEVHIAEPLSEWRLPFFTNTFFSHKIMKILKPEINLSTYKKWFDAIPALEEFLSKDYICCYVIRSVVSSGALQVDKSHDWMLFSVRSDLFDGIKECVTHIDNLEMATSALYHLTIHTPPGADQVQAAELCYTYAKKLRESAQETIDSANKFEKVKVKYYGSRVNQILHTYQLATDACLELISDPNALIEMIYMDPRILQICGSNISSCPDINEAASEIAKLYEMDIVNKQKSLVEAWLFDSSSASADDSIAHVFHSGITNNALENFNDNFKRACYIFTGENISYWQDYLGEIGMNENQSTKMGSHLTKARALKCLYTISSNEKVEAITEVTYDVLTNFVNKLFLLSDMERLGYTISMDKLDQMNKIRLLQELTRRLDKHTVQIMASICTTYSISDFKCWEFIVNNFIKFEQFRALKDAISYLKDIQSFKYKTFYINAWQCVLDHEVNSLRYNITAPIDPNFIDLILMIQTCPILTKLNFSSIVEKFVQLGWWEFVAIFMQFFDFKTPAKRSELIDEITSHCPHIENRLNQYSDQGILILKIMRMIGKE